MFLECKHRVDSKAGEARSLADRELHTDAAVAIALFSRLSD